jgi:hypothetical protein
MVGEWNSREFLAGKAIACCGTRGRDEEKIKLAKRAYVPEDAKSWFPTGIYTLRR